MNWIDEVREKLKRKNQILFSRDSELLHGLGELLRQQPRRVVVLWALEWTEETVRYLEEKYPDDNRPRNALEATKLWAAGEVKMPVAKKEILNCHAMAKELSSQEDSALCHAVSQACSVVHTSGHALGYPIYELTALVRRLGIDNCREAVEKRANEYTARLVYWADHYEGSSRKLAPFLADK